jgi:hypothetical protein
MSLKLTPWLLLPAFSLVACIDLGKDDSTEETEETDTDTDTDTDTNTDTDTDTDEPVVATLDPDYLFFTWSNGFIGNTVADMTFEAAPDYTGNTFSAILYNSQIGDFCAVDWTFNADSVTVDAEYEDGAIPDGDGGEIEGWYGFIITSTPESRGSCDNLGSGQQFFDAFMADQPGFGYGPLTSDLEGSMETEHPQGWENVSPVVFSGIVYSQVLGGYAAINESYAYEVVDGVPAWDPAVQELPQGTEMAIEDVPFAEGFYYSNLYFAFGL